jgi:hypothetical protein
LESKLAELTVDLKSVGLKLGIGDLEDFDVSRGVVAWAKQNASDGLDRYGNH